MSEQKLPEIGKKYRSYDLRQMQDRDDEYQDVRISSIDNITKKINFEYIGYHHYGSITKNLFWQTFEEIPDNSQPEEQRFSGQVGHDSNGNKLPSKEELYKQLKREAQESKPNAVEDALEELKEVTARNLGRYIKTSNEQHAMSAKEFFDLSSKAQNLINALEAEKSVVNSTIPQKPISSIVENTRACEHGDKYPYDFNNGDEVEKRCYACAQEGMVGEEPLQLNNHQTSIYETLSKGGKVKWNTEGNRLVIEKSKSIWKPVSELPEYIKDYFICFIKFYNGEVRLGEYDCGEFYTKDAKSFLKSEMESYVKLTDFVNEHIDMKERLERLENNNKK